MPSALSSRASVSSSLGSSFHHISQPPSDESSGTESYCSLSEDTSSDDEVVYSVSDLSASMISAPHADSEGSQHQRWIDTLSDDDFIVLSRAESPPAAARSTLSGISSLSMSFIDTQDGLFEGFSNLNLDSSDADSVKPASQASSSVKKRKKRARALRAKGGGTPVGATPIPAQTPANVTGPKKKAKKAAPAVATTKAKSKKRSKPKSAPSAVPSTGGEDGLGERPIVDDVSEAGDSRVYEDAVQYVSTFLSSPSEKAKGSGNLTLLQALIIELGLLPTSSSTTSSSFYNLPSLPRSLTAAKALLKSRVFLNVRDYLDVRHKGLEALRNVMHPSRKALVKDLTREKGRRRVPRDLIKNSGLGVLLVTCW